uniref:Secreted protein n=1 Tax=Ixodes scapularis TaxID=6945 RepID=A0A1S4LTD2_IXOSC
MAQDRRVIRTIWKRFVLVSGSRCGTRHPVYHVRTGEHRRNLERRSRGRPIADGPPEQGTPAVVPTPVEREQRRRRLPHHGTRRQRIQLRRLSPTKLRRAPNSLPIHARICIELEPELTIKTVMFL